MRHRKKFNHLSRKTAHRKAMFANMASSLLLHKRIKTTKAKAKALRIYVEPLITKAKHSLTTKTKQEEATHLRRVVFSYLRQKEAVTELFREIAPKIVDRPGGYTRILKLGNRKGDNAETVYIELVDFNENMLSTPKEEKQKEQKKTTRRGRRGGTGAKKKTEETLEKAKTTVNSKTEEVVEAKVEAAPKAKPVEAKTADEKKAPAAKKKTTTTEKKAPAAKKTVTTAKKKTPAAKKKTAATEKKAPAAKKTVSTAKKKAPATKKKTVPADKKTPAAKKKAPAKSKKEEKE